MMDNCSYAGCQELETSSGLCTRHYILVGRPVRKPIAPYGKEGVICDDGTIWQRRHMTVGDVKEGNLPWIRLPDIPQDDK